MTDPQELRRTAVLNVLREGDASVEEIATRMSANYHTIRKSVIELQELGLAHRTGFLRNRKYLWAAGNNAGIPELYDPSNNRKIPVDEVAEASQSGTPASVKAASQFFEILQQLVGIAVDLANGVGQVNPKDLQAIKHQAIVNKMYLNNLLGYYEQVLQNPAMWDTDSLGTIGAFIKEKRA